MLKSLVKKIDPKTRQRLRKWVTACLVFFPKETRARVIAFLNGLAGETFGRRTDIKRTAIEEASKIRLLANTDKVIGLIVFDLDVSPTTIGDFLYAIIIGRWMVNNGFCTKVVVANHKGSLAKTLGSLISEYEAIAASLLRNGELIVTEKSGNQVAESALNRVDNRHHILFRSKVLGSKATHQYFFHLANVLHAEQSDKEKDRSFLFSGTEFPAPKKSVGGKYVVCHARFNKTYGADRNTTTEELLSIIVGIRSVLDNIRIIIATDRVGEEYYLPVIQRFRREVFLSSDFSESFLGDCGLIMNASYYFAYNGGGISVVPMFSRLPFTICARQRNEIYWGKKRLTSWQTKDQKYLSPDKHALIGFDWTALKRR